MIAKQHVALGALALTVLSALLLFVARPVQAQTEKVLYSFGSQAGDGTNPLFGSLIDKGGNLYGTTEYGGKYGYGTMFEFLTAKGTEKVLYNFGGYAGDGKNPYTGLTLYKGNFYSTTSFGGTYGYGTVFELTVKGAEKVLYNFPGYAGDGYRPLGGALVFDKTGSLYGTTNFGGNGYGTVFELTAAGTENLRYSFGAPPDGNTLWAGVTLYKGNLYGTTTYGGGNCGGGVANCGTVFEVTTAGVENPLYDFGSQAGDGFVPVAGVIFDKKGNLYGTTTDGGAYGYGTVFEFTARGKEEVLYSFGSQAGDGSQPHSVIFDKVGNLFGTTEAGGSYGGGTVFELTADGVEKVLWNFPGYAGDGTDPVAGLIFDTAGNLYGTTSGGGKYGGGTVFKLTP